MKGNIALLNLVHFVPNRLSLLCNALVQHMIYIANDFIVLTKLHDSINLLCLWRNADTVTFAQLICILVMSTKPGNNRFLSARLAGFMTGS